MEVYLTDATGFAWRLVEKSVMFDQYDALEADDLELPMEVTIPCEVIDDTRSDVVTVRIPEIITDKDVYTVPWSSLVHDPKRRRRGVE